MNYTDHNVHDVSHPDHATFRNAERPDQREYLSLVDPDFAKASEPMQDKYIDEHVLQQAQPTEEMIPESPRTRSGLGSMLPNDGMMRIKPAPTQSGPRSDTDE